MTHPALTQATEDVRTELEKSAKALCELRDEVRLQVHLGGLEATYEWHRLERRLQATLEQATKDPSDATRTAVSEVTDAIRRLRETLD